MDKQKPITYRSNKAYKSKLYLFTGPINSTVIVHVIPDQGPLIHWEKGENTNTCARDIPVTKGIPTNTLRKCHHFSPFLVFHLLLKDDACSSPWVILIEIFFYSVYLFPAIVVTLYRGKQGNIQIFVRRIENPILLLIFRVC